MLRASFHVYVLQTVITALSLRNTGAFDQVRQPIGPVMCRQHCRQFTHCTNCVFLVESLVCKVSWSLYREQTLVGETEYLDINKDRDGAYLPGRPPCPDRYSRILRTRTGNHRCVKQWREKMTRLLVAPLKVNREIPFIEMHLGNKSTEYHPYLQAISVAAIAYVPSSHRVLIALHAKSYIQSCSLDKNDCVTVRNQTRARYIEVDDALDLVFLTVETPIYRVSRMTPDGRYFKYISRRIGNPSAICLDRTQHIVYVSCLLEIKVFSYDGKARGVINIFIYVFALTLDENVLYVGRQRSVNYIHMPLSSGPDSDILTDIEDPPHNIVHNGDQLYVSHTSVGRNRITVIDRGERSERNIKGNSRQGNIMTLIR